MNIYITKENEDLLKKIKDKRSMSGLVNELLSNYRMGKGPDLFPPLRVENIKVNKDSTISPIDPSKKSIYTTDLKDSTPELTKNIREVHKALNESKVPEEGRYVQTPEGIVGPTKLAPKSMKFCKEGHPIPPGRSKCLGKGCKYS